MAAATNERLATLRKRIANEVRFIGIKPYSHNIVSLTLREIARKFGVAEANRDVRDYRLVAKGFNEEPEEKKARDAPIRFHRHRDNRA